MTEALTATRREAEAWSKALVPHACWRRKSPPYWPGRYVRHHRGQRRRSLVIVAPTLQRITLHELVPYWLWEDAVWTVEQAAEIEGRDPYLGVGPIRFRGERGSWVIGEARVLGHS